MSDQRRLILVLRRGLSTLGDHVQAMLDLGVQIHFLTVDTEDIEHDPRFTSVTRLPHDASQERFTTAAVDMARAHHAPAVITFIEPDIEIVETANEILGVKFASPEAAQISRDKYQQRVFLEREGIPSVWYHPVLDVPDALAAATAHGFPVMVKPTRAAASDLVELVAERGRLAAALTDIKAMIDRRRNFYYEGVPREWALLEGYLPGQEVTLDGVVLDGEFVLGGVHNKAHSAGPYFDEDLYTLPFGAPDREAELTDIARRIVRGLGVHTAMFNAELREDSEGRFRVVEFSIRVSGGHVYRHIKDVYTIDLVRLFVRAACGENVPEILAQENPRREPRMAVCAKVIYANGHVVRNSPGEAVHSPYFRAYYPVGRPGADVYTGSRGFDFTGLMSVWHSWQPGQSPSVVQAVARELASKVDLELRDFPDDQRSGR